MGQATVVPPMPAAFYENRMLTTFQLREMLGVSRASMYRLLRNKKDPLPSYKIGGHRRFKLDKVIWWIEKHEREGI